MKQKLMAAAVAGALAAPGLALAQASNVQIYGVFDARFQHVKYGAGDATINGAAAAAEVTKQQLHTGQPNRWGLRGTENLGNGLRVFFQVESGFALDGRPNTNNGATGGGSNILGGRDTYIGLGHTTWGSIQAGGFGTAYKGVQQVWGVVPGLGHGGIVMGNADTTGQMPSPDCATTDGAVTVCQGPLEGNATSFSRRQGNYIQYTSPQFSGFVFRAGFATSDLETHSNTPGFPNHKPSLASFSLTWSGGPFTVAGAYEQHKGFRPVAGGNTNAKDTGWTLGARWNYGMGLIGIGWERLDYDNSAGAAATNEFKQDNWVIQGTYNLGPSGVLHAGYSRTSGGKNCGTGFAPTGVLTAPAGGAALQGPAACGGAGKASIFSIGYDHRLSKRTAVYAQYGRINNGSGTNYYYIAGAATNNNNTGVLQRGTDVTLFGVGVKHTF